MKTVTCTLDFIPALSLSHLAKLNCEHENFANKMLKKQILDNIENAKLIEKNVIKAGETAILLKEDYMREFVPEYPKSFDEDYMFLIEKDGRQVLVQSEHFGVIKEKRKHEMKDFHIKIIENIKNTN
jgi:hypothetical protein